MNIKRLGFVAALIAMFVAGAKSGIKYAQGHYVSKDRKFIEGEIAKRESRKSN